MSPPLDAASVERFIHQLQDAINHHDASAVAALCCEHVNWMDPAATEPLHGREAVQKFHEQGLFRAIPDVRFEIIDGPYVSNDGRKLAVRTRFQGTMTGRLEPPGFAPTGRTIAFETAEFWELEDGKIARNTVVLDMLALARQVGAMPPAGSKAEHAAVVLQHFAAWWMRLRSPSQETTQRGSM